MFLRSLMEYIAAIWADWLSRMSGIASLAIAFIAAYYELIDNGKPALWIAASSCYVIASFMVWYKYHPDLIIEVREVLLDTNYGGTLCQSNSPLPHFVTLLLYISNTRQADNSIRSYELSVNVYGRQFVGQSFWTDGLTQRITWDEYPDLNKARLAVLKQGTRIEGWLRFGFDGEPSIKGHEFTLTVTDAYNFTRKIKGRIPLDLTEGLIRRPNPELHRA
jgi:hypothetical protein